jgi:GNAT superfamily N-acetyltransferase
VAGTEIRPVTGLLGKREFVDLPFRLHGHDPAWVPPLRYAVYDRLSRRHPARKHQRWQLWTAKRWGKVVGRIAACRDELFDEHQGERWAWVGFFDCVDDSEVAASLFDVALDWSRRQGAEVATGPGNFTTNDEIGLLVEGFEHPAVVMTLENPPYYEALWLSAGWEPAMDLYGYQFTRAHTDLSGRQRRALERLRVRSNVKLREMRRDDYWAEVGRFFDFYNQTWQHNWGYAPMPEAEVRHLARQLKPLLNPRWIFGLERAGELVGVCLTIPDVNQVMVKLRNGRLLPFGWLRALRGTKRVTNVRILAVGIRPDVQHIGLGPLIYGEIVERLRADGLLTAEASWTLATNFRINRQLEAMGAQRYKVWRLYQQRL